MEGMCKGSGRVVVLEFRPNSDREAGGFGIKRTTNKMFYTS